MRKAKYPVKLTKEEREILVQITRKHTAKQNMVRRAKIILMSETGVRNRDIAVSLGVREQVVTTWTKRWCETVGKPVLERLQDLPRPGAPDRFTPEQHCLIIALSCERPADHGRPISDWTYRELAEEAIKQGIVEIISPCHVGRMLKKKDLQPHRIRYWLNVKADERKDERIADICAVYRDVPNNPREISLSVDEMTGIQALERIAPDLPMEPGKPRAMEFEYKRHGTQTLLCGINIATGVVQGSCGETRTEEDFAGFIKRLIETNPGYDVYHFVSDQLNTHKSESLVRFVTDFCNIDHDLGIKGQKGILKSMDTREDFLSSPGKSIIFHYTPKHASWMNQIEIWFGILMKKVIKRGNFLSKDNLRDKILRFIDYFNETMAKPFKWTYQGKVLTG